MNNQPMGFYSPRVVLNDARRWGLEVRPVNVNESAYGFTVEADGHALRVGLRYVKEMSHAAGAAIVAERVPERGGPYRSLPDFCRRTRVSVEIVINLVRVGAFDGLGARREELLVQVPLVHAQVVSGRIAGGAGAGRTHDRPRTATSDGSDRKAADGRLADETPARPRAAGGAAGWCGETGVLAAREGEALQLATDEQFGALPFVPSWSDREKVAVELEVLGLNVRAHPLTFVRDQLAALGVVPFGELHTVPDGRRIRLAGVLERAQMPWIRSGHRTLFLTLEDETGLAEVVVFNDIYLRYGRVLKEAVYLLIEGELQNNDERGLAIVAARIVDLEATLGKLRDLPPDERNRALKRSGEWLPKVEPRTRPGRTG